MADHDALLSQFTDVTGVDAERAKFFLESSAWQLEVALASFYENDGEDAPAFVDRPEFVDLDDDEPEILEENIQVPSRTPVKVEKDSPKPKPASGANTRFGTIASLHQQTNSGSSDEEDGQAFYAGGSRTSGQQVLGPRKKKDIAAEMFKSAQEHGAEVVDPHEAPSRGGGGGLSFGGAGYRLGQSTNDSEVVGNPSSARKEPQAEVVLKLWKTGFSMNDEPIRPYADPENREFLESVRRGEVPLELVRQARGQEVQLNMEDHRHEDFAPTKVKAKAFGGKGNLLGSPAPSTVGVAPPPVMAAVDTVASEAEARQSIPLDPSVPTTTVQVRLADGSRLIGQFNTSHTIADLRTYITTARPQYSNQNFALMTTFPSKELIDGEQTLDQAGILNAALLQRLK